MIHSRITHFLLLLGLLPLTGWAQNITDLAVATDRTADGEVAQSELSTVADSVFLHPERIRFDNRCIQVEGQDLFLLSGAMHYFRVAQPLWRDRLTKLKACGFNCVETYVPWNWHERRMPRSPLDESCLDLSELEAFLRLAEEVGLYVIVRPGPYICAEWSGGGFPQWLMQKRPAKIAYDAWLQSDDPEFVSWSEHWYRAVCRTVAPHQLTRRAPGEHGVILFQIENEYNRVKWFPTEAKRAYLEELARIARRNGIEVPLISCWTSEARNATEGPLNGVVDMVNSYPRWAVEKNFGRLINQQLRSQPGKPLISGELQGGWYSDVGGKLSHEQDGVEAVQTQNITLYALQRGFCALSFYMAVGGTNFDDWASRQVTATYDFGAAIGEDGSLGERSRRFQGLAELLREHGTKIARSRLLPTDYRSTDPDVGLTVRQADNGDRYYFLRTEEHTRLHAGTMLTSDLTLDYALEPFGSMIYYLPRGATQGQWWPKLPEPLARPAVLADTLRLSPETVVADPLPLRWTKLKNGPWLDREGIYGRHFAYYRTFAPQGRELAVGRIGDKAVNGTDADEVLLAVGGRRLLPSHADDKALYFQLPGDSASRKKVEVVMLFESKGLHHHTNQAVEDNWGFGISRATMDGRELPLEYAYTERERGLQLSESNSYRIDGQPSDDALLTWHTYSFTLPEQPRGVWFPYHLHLEHSGNGFIYLNGHCIGRCWQQGPQRDYYLPECWLNRGGDNRIAVSLRPTADGASVAAAAIVPKY